MELNKLEILGEIKAFLEGYNNDLKYLVNVEVNPTTNIAECVIHEPGEKSKIINVPYEPFMYMKDLSKHNVELYLGKSDEMKTSKRIKYGVTVTKLKTGNQKRLVDGYCYKLTSRYSYNSIINYLKDGGIDPYEKAKDAEDRFIKDKKGDYVFLYRDLFYAPRIVEQFFISTRSRLYKGFEEYKNVHKVTFDIETTGLRYQMARVFAIGVRDNRGFETILEAEKLNDDDSEIKLIQDFFNLIDYLKPAVISGYNSEMFDFEFILGRAKLLDMDLTKIPMGLKEGSQIKRKGNTSVKYGNSAEKYTATEMWGYSIIDIIHAAKKTAAVNTEIKATGLKYIAKHEKIARENRTYIKGEDSSIGRFYHENKMFMISSKNSYVQIPDEFQDVAKKLHILQSNKNRLSEEEYKKTRKSYLDSTPNFYEWFKNEALPREMVFFIGGKKLVKQYLLDDLWETEQVDELYNQSSFMLAKIVPTTYQRICTMGTAAVWNLLLTAWSYEYDLAIPVCDKNERFSGGLARCYKTGYSKRIKKIDYASLYPMIQLTDDVFPIFDITGVMKKMLLYLTTTRNIYKKMANTDDLNDEEVTLLKEIDHEVYMKYLNKELTASDIAMFKIKQLPIKILNNSMFGALGSAISFNWSDNVCAARITCSGRLHLRHAISWFSKFGCTALLAVTDGINFSYPEKTRIRVTENGVSEEENELPIEEMWQYGGRVGLNALIIKYNKEEMKPPFMSVDDDGDSISCLNLSRINYATLSLAKDKKTGQMKEKVKLTGNTIKSKTMPEYIEEFIDNGLSMILHGQGKEFVDYYYDYCDNIRYMQIPLKKIASKSKVKTSINAYMKRGVNKNGAEKGMQAHMELLKRQREEIAEELFQKHKGELIIMKSEASLKPEDKIKLVANYMPPEPELDSVVYYVNTGTKKSHGDAKKEADGTVLLRCRIISNADLQDNPNMTGEYNYEKYLAAFNKRVETLLVGFDPEIRKNILVKLDKEGNLVKGSFTSYDLELKNFDDDDFDSSMYLENLEVGFWNKTGYDPRLVWDGFKMYDDDRVYYEIYENALNFLNEKMIAANKPCIKSINSEYGKGDLVLIKDGSFYHVGAFNGTFIEIVRPEVQVPKSEIELELDRKREELEKKLRELEMSELVGKSDKDIFLEAQSKKQIVFFETFKKKHGIPDKFTMDVLFKEIPKFAEAFDDFVNEQSELEENTDDEVDPETEYYKSLSENGDDD